MQTLESTARCLSASAPVVATLSLPEMTGARQQPGQAFKALEDLARAYALVTTSTPAITTTPSRPGASQA